MNVFITNFGFLFLIFSLLIGCGIKKSPVPLPYPEFTVKRIGDRIYLIPKTGDIKPEGFVKKGDLFVRIDSSPFCFKVTHRLGRSVMRCVEGARGEPPSVSITDLGEEVGINLGGYRLFRFYSVSGGDITLPHFLEAGEGEVRLKKSLKSMKVAITGVLGSVESEPAYIEIPAKEVPSPAPPEDLRLIVRGGILYLYWWHREENIRGFIIRKNGMTITGRPIRSYVFSEPAPEEETTYEVIAINRFGKESEPARITYKP